MPEPRTADCAAAVEYMVIEEPQVIAKILAHLEWMGPQLAAGAPPPPSWLR